MENNAEVPASSRDEALFFPAAMCEEPRGGPRNAKEDLTSLRKHKPSDCPALPGEECLRTHHTSRGGWYLLDTGGEPSGLVTIRKPLILHPLEIRPDFLAPFRMSAKNQLTRRRSSDVLVVNPKRAPGPKFNSAGGLKHL